MCTPAARAARRVRLARIAAPCNPWLGAGLISTNCVGRASKLWRAFCWRRRRRRPLSERLLLAHHPTVACVRPSHSNAGFSPAYRRRTAGSTRNPSASSGGDGRPAISTAPSSLCAVASSYRHQTRPSAAGGPGSSPAPLSTALLAVCGCPLPWTDMPATPPVRAAVQQDGTAACHARQGSRRRQRCRSV